MLRITTSGCTCLTTYWTHVVCCASWYCSDHSRCSMKAMTCVYLLHIRAVPPLKSLPSRQIISLPDQLYCSSGLLTLPVVSRRSTGSLVGEVWSGLNATDCLRIMSSQLKSMLITTLYWVTLKQQIMELYFRTTRFVTIFSPKYCECGKTSESSSGRSTETCVNCGAHMQVFL